MPPSEPEAVELVFTCPELGASIVVVLAGGPPDDPSDAPGPGEATA